MIRFLSSVLCTLFLLASLADVAQASGLRQTHPAKKAPPRINTGNQDFNEYPWFTYDGKLMFWTREKPAGSPQKLWAIYIRNRDQIAATTEAVGPGQPNSELPDLDVGVYAPVVPINTWVEQNLEQGSGQPPIELRSYAICHEPGDEMPANQNAHNRWRYKLTIYFSARKPQMGAPAGKLYRANYLFAYVDKTTQDVTFNGNFMNVTEVVPTTFNPWTGETINETEPFFSRDSRYFFWAGSYGFGGMGLESHFMGSYDGCSQINQAPKPYQMLPTASGGPRFYWKDQYAGIADTAYTNYHTLAEMTNGRTALIFEECRGKRAGARETWCTTAPNNNTLSTTGFTAGGAPSNIDDQGWWPNNRRIHLGRGTRATHPAISGGQNSDGSWLLFYMQGKDIFYTKIKHKP